ncbi:type I secretion system permease/ATPase [Sulfitobacter pseudonitzschiae]|uniref:Type I secretion system permease/ATPase n=1 Tax=Pseudosulfitobacter pseudonitzschiae TaxID=1402135 RepID=A0A9Q2NI11_9RHOB|nr:type I secretion system permease/ATPase [Pseudosulfitobacter pseudonitzschiae]MBM2292442.1 type I secretion system permease/ATPase [Pseudosulfitobacter pseudonitzschiae]MBM2297359.1 type I secretion system permease/ATPase [Pseudosulfitobacter pseudonitzschiae]MBM2302273.1 type I secretion system permease/ATPase [Pseudosulfitobacter pseudonitzschiae]MBM2312056.1 type I secretion system permease/ATPase [Pseudosulfitobacter pseudonitzschiae]MBM2316969.1 type I secretion system permease/ATPase 
MQNRVQKLGVAELRRARSESRSLYWLVGVFSLFANLLMLTGPLYMLSVYDRVLGSRSEATLIALSLLVLFLYGVMGILDYTRSRIMARVGARFQMRLDRRVFDAVVRKSAVAPDLQTQSGLADLEAVQRFLTSPVLIAFFDLPWTPIFMAGIFMFHPMLGWLAVGGGVLLIIIAFLNQWLSREPQLRAGIAGQQAGSMSDQLRIEAEMVQAMGMRDAAFTRWSKTRNRALKEQIAATDVGGTFTSMTKTLRLFLQSAMLGLGAYLVLQNEMTAGAMIAGSILLGRALAPIEMMLNQWSLVQRASKGWDNLAELLGTVQPEQPRTALPKPKARLVAKSLTVVPPGEKQASLRGLNFELKPGEALGVIGPSGAGKSTLARCVTGVWRPAGGSIRLDSAALDQYDPDVLGQHVGYLPQRVQLFDGTIAENIARLAEVPDDDAVVAAAKKADAHEMILEFPEGYDTRINSGQQRLSGGQIQRIGLARALYADPVIMVLDEPNSNLDNDGTEALNRAIRAMKADGRSVMIMAHRPSAIEECEMLLILDQGMRVAFGPKDEVLKSNVQNHQQITQAPRRAGGIT